MKILFWICWGIEISVVLFWIIREISQRYTPDPLLYYMALYLTIVLACRFAFDMYKVSTMLVALPAVPLLAVASLFSYTPYSQVKRRG